MELSFEKFLNAIPILGQGMLGVFVVTAVIILCVMILNFLTRKK